MKMKRRLMYSVVAMLSLMAFTACRTTCGGDNETPAPAKEIAKEYKEAVVTNNLKTIPDATVKLDVIDDHNVKVILTNVVAGYPTFEVNALVLAVKAATHTFVGEKDADGMKVTVKGSIVDGNAVVDVAVKITSDVVGKWTYNMSIGDWGDLAMDAVAVKYTNTAGTVSWGGKMISCEAYSANIAELLNMFVGFAINPLMLEFKDNGYISGNISLTEMVGQPQDIPFEDVARYTYDTKTGVLTTDAEINIDGLPVTGVMPIPFMTQVKDSKMVATLGWDFISQFTPLIPQGKDLDALLASLDDVIPPAFAAFLPTIKVAVKDIILSLQADGAKLDLSFKLQKAE